MALSHSFPNSFTALLDFKSNKPTFGTQFTFLMFTHVLDDCPKRLNHVLDILRIEKLFEYFFRKFDVVSLVVLEAHDIQDQLQTEASRGGRHNTCVQGTWNLKYLRKTTSIVQGKYDVSSTFNVADLIPFVQRIRI